MGFLNAIFEGDLETSIKAIRNQTSMYSFFGHIIRDIWSYITSFQRFSFSHICRQGNALADALAKRAKLFSPFLVWMESVPLDLYNCYLADFQAFQ